MTFTVAAGLSMASPAHAAGGTTLTSLKLSSTTVQDVTYDPANLGVTLRLASSSAGNWPILWARPRGTYGGSSVRTDPVFVQLKNSSGTDSDRTLDRNPDDPRWVVHDLGPGS